MFIYRIPPGKYLHKLVVKTVWDILQPWITEPSWLKVGLDEKAILVALLENQPLIARRYQLWTISA